MLRRDLQIDWNYVRPKSLGRSGGLTNFEAAVKGFAPIRVNPSTGRLEKLVLHHSNKEPGGALIGAWGKMHGRRHHGDRMTARGLNKTKYDPLANWRKDNPTWKKWFNDEKAVFWKWYSIGRIPRTPPPMPPAIAPRLP
jgi:hypothetical protein